MLAARRELVIAIFRLWCAKHGINACSTEPLKQNILAIYIHEYLVHFHFRQHYRYTGDRFPSGPTQGQDPRDTIPTGTEGRHAARPDLSAGHHATRRDTFYQIQVHQKSLATAVLTTEGSSNKE